MEVSSHVQIAGVCTTREMELWSNVPAERPGYARSAKEKGSSDREDMMSKNTYMALCIAAAVVLTLIFCGIAMAVSPGEFEATTQEPAARNGTMSNEGFAEMVDGWAGK